MVEQISSGLVRIKYSSPRPAEPSAKPEDGEAVSPETGSSTNKAATNLNGNLQLILIPAITAADLHAQLQNLGICNVSVDELETIARQNGDSDFDLEELAGLDAVLEKKSASSKEFMLTAVKKNGLLLQFASKKLRGDFDVCMAAVAQNGRALSFVNGDRLWDIEPPEKIKEIYQASARSLENQDDIEGIISFLRNGSLTLIVLPPKSLDNKEIVLAGLKAGNSLTHASIRLQSDPLCVFYGLAGDDVALTAVQDNLMHNREFMTFVLSFSGKAHEITPQDEKKAIALANSGSCEALWRDRKFLEYAFSKNSWAATFAAPEVVNDFIFLERLARQASSASRMDQSNPDQSAKNIWNNLALLGVWQNLVFAEKLLTDNPKLFDRFHLFENKPNKELILIALWAAAGRPELIKEIGEQANLAANRDTEFMLACVEIAPSILRGHSLAWDEEFALEAIALNRDAYYYVSEYLKADPAFSLEAIRIIVGEQDFEIYKTAYEQYGISLPQRFEYPEDLVEVMANRDNLPIYDTRPLAMSIPNRNFTLSPK